METFYASCDNIAEGLEKINRVYKNRDMPRDITSLVDLVIRLLRETEIDEFSRTKTKGNAS